jgi:hypothetical protein
MAQEAASQEPARFLIETVIVEGPKQAPANIVRAETLLREGETYTEDQLRQAVYRVHRLPFVLDASFSLRKGSQRGAYELVIEVQPARWFFYDHSIRAFSFDQPVDLEDDTLRGDRSSLALSGLAGARLFVGRSGVVFGALDSREGIQAGFTQYDLFHRGILASAGVSWNECCVTDVLPLSLDPTFSSWSFGSSRKVSASIAVPLGGSQSIQAALSERRGGRGTRDEVLGSFPQRFDSFATSQELTYRRAEAKWVYDTSDDPLVPTRGLGISAGIEVSRLASRDLIVFDRPHGPDFPPFGATPLPSSASEQVLAAVSAIRHWSITPRQTVSLQGRAAVGQARQKNLVVEDRIVRSADVDVYGGSLGLRHSVTLKRSRGAGKFTDLRLESEVEAGLEATSPDFGPSPLERFSASIGLVFRNQWGRVRAILTYLDLGEVMR